ncbi:hypothetical protein NQ317_002802 [Molorchus minor]|uniref:Uncharacterized protein n=1 Tax=Molorchus minor TaxID=1323400 RepID=A0ABQ9J6M9_9CUCU|nr:hypothetical protein NQ317_002802 [Molorchus minor]
MSEKTDLMYKDPIKWSFRFQSYVQLTILSGMPAKLPVCKEIDGKNVASNESEEKAISFNYINDLHDIHEDWLYYKYICPASVIT